MPTYSYQCSSCSSCFELICSIKDYKEHPKCPTCLSKETARRYSVDLSSLNTSIKKSDCELKTLGDLAKRNSDRMSDDHKQDLHNKHNAYKEVQSEKELPTGMSRMKLPKKKPKWR